MVIYRGYTVINVFLSTIGNRSSLYLVVCGVWFHRINLPGLPHPLPLIKWCDNYGRRRRITVGRKIAESIASSSHHVEVLLLLLLLLLVWWWLDDPGSVCGAGNLAVWYLLVLAACAQSWAYRVIAPSHCSAGLAWAWEPPIQGNQYRHCQHREI